MLCMAELSFVLDPRYQPTCVYLPVDMQARALPFCRWLAGSKESQLLSRPRWTHKKLLDGGGTATPTQIETRWKKIPPQEPGNNALRSPKTRRPMGAKPTGPIRTKTGPKAPKRARATRQGNVEPMPLRSKHKPTGWTNVGREASGNAREGPSTD
jgi:hypothetical protein